MRIWDNNEIEFLKNNYPIYGLDYCFSQLNKSKSQIRAKVARLELKRVLDDKYAFQTFSKIVSDSINFKDVCRRLKISTNCGNRITIKKYIKLYNLSISHFFIPIPNGRKKINIEDILVENSTFLHTTNLKDKLYFLGMKIRECEICGQNEHWKRVKISLILDHINGISNDNRLENLRIVCPNCNAGLETNGGKNIRNKYSH